MILDHLECIQLLVVRSYPLRRVPLVYHLLFIFAASNLPLPPHPITSHLELINGAALVSSLLCVTNLTGSSWPVHKSPHSLAVQTIYALALTHLSKFIFLYAHIFLYSRQTDVPFILRHSLRHPPANYSQGPFS